MFDINFKSLYWSYQDGQFKGVNERNAYAY